MLAILAAVLAGTVQEEGKPEASNGKPATVRVRRGPLIPKLELDVTFDPARAHEADFRLDAFTGTLRIHRILPHGTAVKKGEVVLQIEDAPVARALEAAGLDLDSARSALAKEEADAELGEAADALALEKAEAALRDAETELKIFDEVDGPQMLARADLTVKRSEDGVKDQEEELQQLLNMYKSEELTNATSEIVVRRSKRALERAKVFLDMTRETARVTKETRHPQRRRLLHYAVEGAKGALKSLTVAQAHGKVLREASLAKARMAVAAAERKVRRLTDDVKACAVRAPFNGTVAYGAFRRGAWPTAEEMERRLGPGDPVPAGQPLLTILAPGVAARAQLPEKSYFEVGEGQEAVVTAAARPDVRIRGRVVDKAIALRMAGQPWDVTLALDAPPEGLLPGMKGRAELRGRERPEALLVPKKAVSTGAVKVWDGGKAVSRKVKTGADDGELVEILDGLAEGDEVVLPE